MPPRTNLELTIPGSEYSHQPINVPELALTQNNERNSGLVQVEEGMQLHIAAMYAHERKAECFIEINSNIANKSVEAFSDYARSSEARVSEAEGMMFAKDVQLVEHHFRQSFFNVLDANARDMARQTGMLAAMPLPREKPKKGFWERLLGE